MILAFSGAQRWVNSYVTHAFCGVHGRQEKTKSGCTTPALAIAPSPLRSWESPEEGRKSKVATSTLPSPGP